MFRYICHVHLYVMSLTFWYWWHQCLNLLHLRYFCFTRKSVIVHWQTNGTDCHTCGTCSTFAFIQRNNYLCSYYRSCSPVYHTNVCNWTTVVTVYDLHYYMNTVNFQHIYTHTHTQRLMAEMQGLNSGKVSYKVILISLTTMTTVIVIRVLKSK